MLASNFFRYSECYTDTEAPARHLDVSRPKLTPHCLATIFDSQLPSPKLSPKMHPKLSLAHKRGHFFLFQNDPCGEGNCETIERQKSSRGNFCPATSRCLFWPTGEVPNLRTPKSPPGHAWESATPRWGAWEGARDLFLVPRKGGRALSRAPFLSTLPKHPPKHLSKQPLLSYFEFFGVRGVLAGFEDLKNGPKGRG